MVGMFDIFPGQTFSDPAGRRMIPARRNKDAVRSYMGVARGMTRGEGWSVKAMEWWGGVKGERVAVSAQASRL